MFDICDKDTTIARVLQEIRHFFAGKDKKIASANRNHVQSAEALGEKRTPKLLQHAQYAA